MTANPSIGRNCWPNFCKPSGAPSAGWRGPAGYAEREERQQAWVKTYDLKQYPGKIHSDGVQAMIETIMNSPRPVTVIAVGPVPNLAEALKREPRIAERARFVGMHGSVRVGYGNDPKIAAEHNVKRKRRKPVRPCSPRRGK